MDIVTREQICLALQHRQPSKQPGSIPHIKQIINCLKTTPISNTNPPFEVQQPGVGEMEEEPVVEVETPPDIRTLLGPGLYSQDGEGPKRGGHNWRYHFEETPEYTDEQPTPSNY